MRKLVLSALILASVFQTAVGETWGDFYYDIDNGKVIIFQYNGSAPTVIFPSEINNLPVTAIGAPLNWGGANYSGDWPVSGGDGLGTTSLIVPNSVTSIGRNAFGNFTALTSVTMPDGFIGVVSKIGLPTKVATDYIINALANNDAFVTAVANKILAKSGNYGLSVKSELETLATKTELTSSLAQSRTDGINSVLSNPNLWTLYTTSQIQNMAVGDLVLTRQVSGGFVLNYDIEQSTDLQTWTTYQALSLPLTGLPTDKAFVRIKPKQ